LIWARGVESGTARIGKVFAPLFCRKAAALLFRLKSITL
jgi:hypothetical protein